jgi:hypothetical protein
MKDWRLIHREKAIRERRELLMADATREQFIQAARERKIPAGSQWLWALGVVGPENSASTEDQWWQR